VAIRWILLESVDTHRNPKCPPRSRYESSSGFPFGASLKHLEYDVLSLVLQSVQQPDSDGAEHSRNAGSFDRSKSA
jgi:hypothetical protein